MTMYRQTLRAARRKGAVDRTDAEAMAAYCADLLTTVAGAFSPQLVWEGAQRAGLTTAELSRLATARDNDALDRLQFGD